LPRELDYTNTALADLDAIGDWLAQQGAGRAARRRLTAIWASIERLALHPCLFPVVHHPGVRELPCDGGYRVLYELHPDTGRSETAGNVRVLRVFGPGQDRSTL
jgi:plasmid stabilization system protein ParE